MRARNLKIATAFVILASVGSSALASAAFGESDTPTTDSKRAASQFETAMSTADKPAFLRDRTALENVLLERRGPIDLGPIRSELGASDSGAMLLNTADGTRFSVIPTSRGDLCYTASEHDVPMVSGCIQEFPDSGVFLAMSTFTGGDMRDELRGLLLPDVESATVQAVDGRQFHLEPANGAVTWTAPDAATRIHKVITVRGGVTSEVIADSFNPPVVS